MVVAIINIINKYPEMFHKVCLLNPLINTSYLLNGYLLPDLLEEAYEFLIMHEPQYYQNELQLIQNKHNPQNMTILPCTIIQSSNDEILSPSIAQQYCKSNNCIYLEINAGTHVVEGHEKEIILGVTGRTA